MFIEMLKKQTTIVHNLEDAEKYSPFRLWLNERNNKYVVSKLVDNHLSPVAAGMSKEEAEACLMFKANEYVLRQLHKGA